MTTHRIQRMPGALATALVFGCATSLGGCGSSGGAAAPSHATKSPWATHASSGTTVQSMIDDPFGSAPPAGQSAKEIVAKVQTIAQHEEHRLKSFIPGAPKQVLTPLKDLAASWASIARQLSKPVTPTLLDDAIKSVRSRQLNDIYALGRYLVNEYCPQAEPSSSPS